MLRCNIQSASPSPTIFLSFKEKPMKCTTFLDHFKGNPDLCMQTQMKTDPLVDEKGKATQRWSTRFCDMLMTWWPCWFPQCIPNAFFVNHVIDRLISERTTVSQPQVQKWCTAVDIWILWYKVSYGSHSEITVGFIFLLAPCLSRTQCQIIQRKICVLSFAHHWAEQMHCRRVDALS